MKSPSRRSRRVEHENNRTAPNPNDNRQRKFTFDEDVIYEEEEDEEQRHESEDNNNVIRSSSNNKQDSNNNHNWLEEGYRDDLVLHSMKTASESNDYDGSDVRDDSLGREDDDEYLSEAEEGSYTDSGSQVFEAEEYYYEEGENSTGSYDDIDQNGDDDENEIFESNEYGDGGDDDDHHHHSMNMNHNEGIERHQNNPDLHLEVDSFCASTITSRWDDFMSPKRSQQQKLSSPNSSPTSDLKQQQQQSYDERINNISSSNTNVSSHHYDQSVMNQNSDQLRSMVASPVSVPDPNLDKYYIENVSTTSSALLHQKRREKEKKL